MHAQKFKGTKTGSKLHIFDWWDGVTKIQCMFVVKVVVGRMLYKGHLQIDTVFVNLDCAC